MAMAAAAAVALRSSSQDIPTAVPVPQKPASSRRLPPPCWSHDETVALMDAYRDKWYSLRRGNLRANHWQEVADGVASRCSPAPGNPPKTSMQCRHKMEKLRKRYRSEMQRALSMPGSSHRFSSSWVHFKRMDSMEKGPSAAAPPTAAASESAIAVRDEDDDDDEDLYQATVKRALPYNRSGYEPMSNGIGGGSGGANGFRIRIPGIPNVAMPGAKICNKFDGYSGGQANPKFAPTRVLKDGYSKLGKIGGSTSGDGLGKKRREGDPVEEMVAALKSLRDGFVRMERMRMEMAREVESMRMEMEMRRTETILESQQRIVEAFTRAFSEKQNKKVKRMPAPKS